MWLILNIYLLAALYTIVFSYNPMGIMVLCVFVSIVYLIDSYTIEGELNAA